ncbi:MAG TPA: PDDEXK nuclease domain-containing protein [Candidatus Competibacter sp.]|nr:PDDEXK nuclease domain-containing protein [Candidatus Competibacter sp.]
MAEKPRADGTTTLPAPNPVLVTELRQLIDAARQRAATAVNAELTRLYWQVGERIHRDILGSQRAGYGEVIIPTLSKQLTVDYGRGFSAKNLRHMLRFAEAFPDEEKVSALRRQLSWTHIKALIYLDDPLKRDFYTELCRLEGWSSRQLQERIQSLLFERSAISRQPVLLELGAGFTFVARQKRLQIDDDDFYIDLLFYNRKLKRLVAIDLKTGDFRAEYKGQMELYLRWLARHEQEPDENPPLGIILCTGKKQEQIELLELDKSGIHVAEYLTVLPPRETLQAKLRESIERARQRLLNPNDDS